MFIQRLVKSLQAFDVNYALVGGYAVALHGAVRGTMDIDLVIKIDELAFSKVEKALAKINLEARLPVTASDVFHFRDEYINNRNMIAWSFVNPNNPTEMVDIIITENLASLQSVTKQAFGLNIQVLSIEDLITMKTKAGRPQDIEDVKVLETLR